MSKSARLALALSSLAFAGPMPAHNLVKPVFDCPGCFSSKDATPDDFQLPLTACNLVVSDPKTVVMKGLIDHTVFYDLDRCARHDRLTAVTVCAARIVDPSKKTCSEQLTLG